MTEGGWVGTHLPCGYRLMKHRGLVQVSQGQLGGPGYGKYLDVVRVDPDWILFSGYKIIFVHKRIQNLFIRK